VEAERTLDAAFLIGSWRRDAACAVTLERRGPYLLVNDNARCGGNNVRFVGIYIRRAAR